MTGFDWARIEPVADATPDEAVEMIERTLRILEDLLCGTNHSVSLRLSQQPLIKGSVSRSAEALLGDGLRPTLSPLASWSRAILDVLPGWFAPAHAAEGSPPRRLAEGLTEWLVALLGQVWPPGVEAYLMDVKAVEKGAFWDVDYVDIVVRVGAKVWHLHIGRSD
ncbi:hypothetical protein BJY16_004870 [Actinoplanes octamycinicus]|uniref:Uncharacterized protein n=1 Tax=Actinoplanes octamycinicus TaxID=135948 RepID=A0A7W7GZX1_9ACTN|nr:hypothetical protein [Actinoplanes octamycinicus]MBB4741411.1 hypothetical protein [Actinoplanes octamycinicus]GIE62792.1 hypothetical protein Aoc01nite_81940 [Actinoplanes octamycinicus]